MVSSEQSLALGCALACVTAVAWLVLADHPVSDPGRPSTNVQPPPVLVASVPDIGEFSQFNVNDENPFVPSRLREIESKARKEPKRPPTPAKPKPAPSEPARAAPVLPKLGTPGDNGPQAVGVIQGGGQAVVLLRIGGRLAEPVAVGESVGGWTVQAIADQGSRVVLREDSSGTLRESVIPVAEEPPEKSPEPTHDPKDKGKDRTKDKGPDRKGGPTAGAKAPKRPLPPGAAPAPPKDDKAP